MLTVSLSVKNPSGLHARPATQLCDLCQEFSCDLSIHYDGTVIEPRSILNILCAGIPVGSTIQLTADGEDEQAAIDAISALINQMDE